MKKGKIHIAPHGRGSGVKNDGTERASKVTETKKVADEAGRNLAKKGKTELVIHGRNGKIQDSDSYGNDPYPPKDTKH